MMKNRIEELRSLIKQHNHLYYDLDAPAISDSEYDQMYAELKRLEAENPQYKESDSPTIVAGGTVKSGFLEKPHDPPMMSIETSTRYDDHTAIEFVERMGKYFPDVELAAEYKYDGMALDVQYVDGKLTQALTRGNYYVGEDVTVNAMQIKNLPKTIDVPGMVQVRGEVMLPKAKFASINEKRNASGEKPFANCRNAAAGTMRQLDPAVVASRGLIFVAYSLIKPSEVTETGTQLKDIIWLKGIGFEAAIPVICKNAQELIYFYNDVIANRDKLAFDIDGVVYKVNSGLQRKSLGFVGKEPRWAIAHKFKPEQATATILAIDIQIGRTGKVTPVARITPTFVGGTTITNVTLHNLSEIHRKDIRVGDEVYVRRAGDVIPEIVGPVNKSSSRSNAYDIPTTCPHCDTPLKRVGDGIDHYCDNPNCQAKTHRYITNFVSKAAFDIEGLAEKTIDQLIQKGLLFTSSDLFSLGCRAKHPSDYREYIRKASPLARHQLMVDSLMSLDGFQERSIQNFIRSINDSKVIPLDRFIYSLGIRHVGITTAKELAVRLGTLEAFLNVTKEQLDGIDDVGPETSMSILKFLKKQTNRENIEDLCVLGVVVIPVNITTDGPYKGFSFLMTGAPLFASATAFENKLMSLGARIQNSVTLDTDVLIVGNKPGKTKMARAEQLNVPYLDISETESEANALDLIAEFIEHKAPKSI